MKIPLIKAPVQSKLYKLLNTLGLFGFSFLAQAAVANLYLPTSLSS